jgi:hypothetical protein
MICTVKVTALTGPAGAPHCIGMNNTMKRSNIQPTVDSHVAILFGKIFSFTSTARTAT